MQCKENVFRNLLKAKEIMNWQNIRLPTLDKTQIDLHLQRKTTNLTRKSQIFTELKGLSIL